MSTLNNLIVVKINEVKKGIFTEVMEKIKNIMEIASDFHHTNLKIHNVSYYVYQAVQSGLITDEQSLRVFNEIAQNEYEHFEEWEAKNLNYVKRSYIGLSSSFYYDSNWYGDIIENDVIEELLEGKEVTLSQFLGFLQADFYNILLEEGNGIEQDIQNIIDNMYIDNDDIETSINDFFESDIESLELLSDDLNTVLEIVLEAKKAYNYLAEYKTKENEYSLAEEYLEHDLIEYYAERKANEILDAILENNKPLNKIETIDFKIIDNAPDTAYLIEIKTNLNEMEYNTEICNDHALSQTFIEAVENELKLKIAENFALDN